MHLSPERKKRIEEKEQPGERETVQKRLENPGPELRSGLHKRNYKLKDDISDEFVENSHNMLSQVNQVNTVSALTFSTVLQ
jgi:hypothetical protein